MAKWWYITVHKCPSCGATYDEYDSSGPWYDSGLQSASVVEEYCLECAKAIGQEEEDEDAE